MMSRYHSYLNSAKDILQQYDGQEPLSAFLKRFFSENKKYGSKDRKQISHLCYCYFRLGKMVSEMATEERLLAGLFLCSEEPNEILGELKPGWNEKVSLDVYEKLSLLREENSVANIFPFADELSEGIEKEAFILSHLKQPDVFLRLRPGNEEVVKRKLEYAGLVYRVISNNCLALANASNIDSIIDLDKEAVVQDLSSQRVGDFYLAVRPGRSDRVWDCCAASGGKSILLHDVYPGVDLTVSDVRASILINLKKRFNEAGIINYKIFVADLTAPDFIYPTSKVQLIIADVPCSGSGTWGRTPEQLYYFKKEKINEYVSLQKKIVANVIPHLRPGGYLLYITCSVFKKENEDLVDFIKQNLPLDLVRMEVLKGYDKKADTMFAALLRKPE
jgi:16S rRNA (cytosine967-C5)-methyltransferase